MKLELELKPGDIVLLKVLACVLIIFFTFRFLILPGVGKHQDLDLEQTQVDHQTAVGAERAFQRLLRPDGKSAGG